MERQTMKQNWLRIRISDEEKALIKTSKRITFQRTRLGSADFAVLELIANENIYRN
jgi:hypothetical protein